MSANMKAVCFVEPHKVSCQQVPKPELIDDTDAIVKLVVGAICGSDLHPYRGDEVGLDAGCPMGHEFAGIVEQVGSKVESLEVGDKVCSPFTTSCGKCFYCVKGLTCRCTKGALFGWVQDGKGLAGAQAEYVRVPLADGTLVKLPEKVSFEHSLLAGDILSTGMYCAMQAGVGQSPHATQNSPFAHNAANTASGETDKEVIVVIGCGPVGLLSVLASNFLLHKAGTSDSTTIVAVDRVAERLSMASEFGADVTLNFESDNVKEKVFELTGGRGGDMVLELVGQPGAMRLAMDCLRPGGVLSSVGVHAYDTFRFGPEEGYDKNLTLRMGRCPARSIMSRAFELLQEPTYATLAEKLLTHRVTFENAPGAYVTFEKQQQGMIKCLLYPNEVK